MQEKINPAKARPEDRCERCMGRKKVMSAACWLVDCPVCKGVGFVKKEAVEGIQRLTDEDFYAFSKACAARVRVIQGDEKAPALAWEKPIPPIEVGRLIAPVMESRITPLEPADEAIEKHAGELSALELVKMKRAKKKKG